MEFVNPNPTIYDGIYLQSISNSTTNVVQGRCKCIQSLSQCRIVHLFGDFNMKVEKKVKREEIGSAAHRDCPHYIQ